ncbi:uncharacterized protein BP5553_08704 [Venustampulla echinocandica]|uniref:Fork-head domain-containing protein n=1 Tax=Venustampulla echinocandica TaxID=2656787 RepID=A0A370TEZ9_9HELO|nr:uncharacterized protein BP5553_08704 [Venustampulla echinocandica]RDL33265.1 hypothetical protein BP5553_08704 [Venustampulla echinocandica]
MNSGQYHRRPQMESLHSGYQHSESPSPSTRSTRQMATFNGPSRMQSGQQYIVDLSTTPAMHPDDYSLAISTAMPQSSAIWSTPNQAPMNFDDQTVNDYYGYSSAVASNEPEGSFLRGIEFSEIPRSWTPYDPSILYESNLAVESLGPSVYMIHHDDDDMHRLSDRSTLGFDALENSQRFSRLSISRSPKLQNHSTITDHLAIPNASHFKPPPCEDSDGGGRSSREMTATDPDDHSAEEPYAKLIHRALMSVPSHSMVLQEIYQWFRDNTMKGNADNKGWMNSIRHNLSMNAAFKKTERKIAGDETKKSTEWVLEDFAIKDGVQSTTRYRKGTGAKKFVKSDNPTPSRQSSGRKGGISARQTKLQRQRIREERSDSRRGIQKHDTHQSQFLQHTLNQRMQRLSSPSTPPSHENMPSMNPYFLPKAEQLEVPYEDMCGLEVVQGVYLDDGPVFTSNHDGLPGY